MMWSLIMVWSITFNEPEQRQVIYYGIKEDHCFHALEIRHSYLQQSDWPYKNTTRFKCERIE